MVAIVEVSRLARNLLQHVIEDAAVDGIDIFLLR